MPDKRLVIIDGYSLLYRAFFATRYLSTSDGRPTNALFGFTSMLFLLLEKVKPDAIVVALDAPGKTFRHAEYEGYKGTRKETQDELRVQLVEARRFVDALGIPTRELVGFEADDVVGTISKQAETNGYFTTIVTGDLDALQLVDDCISVLTPSKGMSDTFTYGPKEVEERYGFGPKFVPDFKALKGDTSDNIPGVPGIGDKGAAELIQSFGAIEDIIARFDDLPAKYQKRIDGNQEQMGKSKYLATIIRDAPIEYDFKPFILTDSEMDTAVKMLESFEFRQHAKRAPQVLGGYRVELRNARIAALNAGNETTTDCVPPAGAMGDIPVQEGLYSDGNLSKSLIEDEALEIQQTSANSYDELAEFVGADAFAVFFTSPITRDSLFDDEKRAFVAVGTRVMECREADAFQLVGDRPSSAILHDGKPVFRKLISTRPNLAAPRFDSLLAAYVLRSERSTYPLRDLVQGYLDIAPPTSPGQMAAALGLLEKPLRERLALEHQMSVLDDIELPLVPILAEMESLGIRADRSQLREFSKELEIALALGTQTIYDLAGQTFTIASPKQLGEVLFEKLKIPGASKTKTGYATGAEVLGDLAAQYPICAEILRWRELSKLKSTYADSLEKLIQPDGRIHTTYNQAVAATGRLSSNDPNLQNIPIRTELGRGIRKAFRAADGYQLASLDYSQIELRVLAHLCGEKALVDAFNRHEDVHTVTAQQMFGLGEGAVTKEQRRLAKMLNYAVLYGVSEFGLAQQLGAGFSISEAKALIVQYDERFPSVKGFTASVVQEARSKGFTSTLSGRRRYFPEIHAPKHQERKYAERQAMNAPIQGTAADMIKLAMIKAHRTLKGTSTRMLLNVHDELVFEVPNGEESIVTPLKLDMEVSLPLNVPIEVDAKMGLDWNEMTPV